MVNFVNLNHSILSFHHNRKESPKIPKAKSKIQLNEKKEAKMAKTKNRIKSMKFQRQDRIPQQLKPLSQADINILETSGYKKGLIITDEKIPRYANSSG